MTRHQTLLAKLIFNNCYQGIQGKEWEYIIALLRESNLLASCYYRLKNENNLELLPPFALKHMTSAVKYSQRQALQVNYECEEISKILASADISAVFLKGASYTLRKSQNSMGRIYSDIDVLVDFAQLHLAENTLSEHGWKTKDVNEYDDRYYREWSHEIPPMFNIYRATVLDLHHNIAPPISGKSVDTTLLLEGCITLDSGLKVLSICSTIIHSAVHLMCDEELNHGYRDLLDICTLIRQHADETFWQSLINKAHQLNYAKELYIVLSLCKKLKGLTVSNSLLEQLQAAKSRLLLDFLIKHVYLDAIQPQLSNKVSFKQSTAQLICLILGHINKMPVRILLPHLLNKSFLSLRDKLFGKYYFEK